MTSPLSALLTPSIVRRIGVRRARLLRNRVAIVVGTVVIAGLTAKGISGDYVYSAPWACRCRSVRWCWRHRSWVSSAVCRAGCSQVPCRRSQRLVARPKTRSPRGLCCWQDYAGWSWRCSACSRTARPGGTGYAPVRALLSGQGGSDWLGTAKFATMLAGYFTGVVRAPPTGVIILSENTGSGNAILPLLTTALIADQVGAWVCRERLYHALAKDFGHKPSPPPNADEP